MGDYDNRADGKLTSLTNPLNRVTGYAYDKAGNRTAVTDVASHTTLYSYDENDHLTYVTDAAAGVVSYQYDGAGNRTAMVDANLHQTAYTFDGLNRTRTETDPETRLTTTTYDDLASRVTITRPDNTSVVKQLDELGRTGTITYPDQTVSYVYDTASQLQTMTDGTGTTTYGYDGAGRVTSVASPQGTLGYGYDAAGRRNRIDYPGSRSVNYTFDLAGRMATVTDWASKQAVYGYDDAGRKTSQTNPNGTSSSFSYDGAGRLTGLGHLSGLTTIASFTYTPDPAGNPLSVAEVMSLVPGGTTSYAYDSLDRLTSASYPGGTFATYQYDAMGNRTQLDTTRSRKGTTTYSYDRSDRLTSSSGAQAFSFSYDPRGNETAKGTSTFGYDSANRLTSANTGTTATYSYNGEGVRAGKTVGGVATNYLQDVVGGLPRVLVETTGSQQTLYVYGNGLAWEVRPDGTHRYYHADSLGSTRVVTNDAGSPVSAYSYDAYGAVRASAGEARSFTYTGEETDPESGLEFLRARTYDPQSGRFLQRDPVLTVNRYAYAGGNPIRYVDPAGTDWQDALDFLQGLNHGYSDSMSFGLAAQARQAAGVNSPDSDLYYLGRAFGDAGASASGAGIAGGTASGDAVLVVGTGGTGAVTIPAAAPIVAYGMTEAANASANAGRDLGTFFAKRSRSMQGAETLPATCSEAGAQEAPSSYPTQYAKRRLAKEKAGIPRSSSPIAQGGSTTEGRWWEYKDTDGVTRIVVEHPDGSVHVGTPKEGSMHREGGVPKYYDDIVPGGFGHVGEP